MSGRFYQQFAVTIAAATVISAFNSLTLSPALAALLLKPHDDNHKRSIGQRLADGFNRGFDRLSDGYASDRRLRRQAPLRLPARLCAG